MLIETIVLSFRLLTHYRYYVVECIISNQCFTHLERVQKVKWNRLNFLLHSKIFVFDGNIIMHLYGVYKLLIVYNINRRTSHCM